MTEQAILSGIAANTLRTIPRGEEGLSQIIELQNQAVTTVYPEARNHLSRLVTKVDQLSWVSADELDKIHQKSLQEKILYRTLRSVGISLSSLKKHFVNSDQQATFEFQSTNPRLFFPRNTRNKISDDKPLKRLDAMINVAVNVFEANLNLLPQAKEIDCEIKPAAKRACRDDLDQTIKSVMLDVGDSLGVAELNVIESLMYSLIYSADLSYTPRLVSFGGYILLLLPHQNLDSAECVASRQFHTYIYYYLSTPVINELFNLVVKEGYVKEKVSLVLSPKALQRARLGKEALAGWGIQDRDEAFHHYLSSHLAEKNLMKVN